MGAPAKLILTHDTNYYSIANAIRDKGVSGTFKPSEMAAAIASIQSGGGGTPNSGIVFIDYDGSIVESWNASSVASKTSLPNNPSHTGLVAQGWNWSLADIKDYIEDYPTAKVIVGQMYATASGLTEIDITVTKVTGLTVTCKMIGNKNWGDGTEDNLTSHTYTDYGDYTITCDGTSIPKGTTSLGGMFSSSSSNVNRFWCTAIRLSNSVTSIGSYAFFYCVSLTSITIPDSVTSIAERSISPCQSLTSITIPDSVTSIGTRAVAECSSLASITIPDSVTSIGTGAFSSCGSLTSITIPDRITSIEDTVFSYCYSLTSITIPDSVTSIGTGVFSNCRALITYNFSSATSVPSLSNSNAFSVINGICKIIVPDVLYDDWVVATNWATYANYIYKASEVTD